MLCQSINLKMNILILGSGGREHALAYKIKKSSWCEKLYIGPGNAGTRLEGENVKLSILDFPAIANFITENNIGVLVVGPETPSVHGIYDYFIQNPNYKNLIVVSPSQAGAMLEGSKSYAKEFMIENKIPTASYLEVNASNIEAGIEFLKSLKPPYVLKADGLAEGKGVVILNELEPTIKELRNFIIDKKFGTSSEKVVIEKFLDGIEFSIFVYTDGIQYQLLPNAKDYKRIGEGNTGLNTGGMGCISPVPFVNEALMQKVISEIINPTIEGLKKRNIAYNGFIYFGLMLVDHQPYVIEYNTRLGDPEAEVILPRMKSDLLELMILGSKQQIHKINVEIDERACCTVMLVSGGYPESYDKGKLIEFKSELKDSKIFYAGAQYENGQYFTNGGRVLAVTSFGNTIKNALSKSYENINHIHFEKKYFRRDIGFEFKEEKYSWLKDSIYLGTFISLVVSLLMFCFIYFFTNYGAFRVILELNPSLIPKVLTLCIIPNVGTFFGALNLNKLKLARGIVFGMFIMGAIMMYYWFLYS